jgi:ribosomal protein S18 acetylase RimI-like enzyme
MSYEVRPATLDDAEGLIRLWNDAGLHLYPETPMQAEIESVLARNPEGILIASDDTGIIGSVIGTFDGRRGWINRLATRSDRRGLGVARDLMNRIQDQLAALGCRKVNLLVSGDNTNVVPFYESIGFQSHELVFMERYLTKRDVEKPE